MRNYNNFIVNQFSTLSNGNSGANLPVTVRMPDTGVKAVLYNKAGEQIDNPVFSGPIGNYSFYIDEGVYDIVINEGATSQFTVKDEPIITSSAIEFKDLLFDQVRGGTSDNLVDSALSVGERAETKGYHSNADGGGNTYIVKSPSDPTIPPIINELNNITLANGNIAVSQDSTGDIRKYGAINGQLSTANIQAAIDSINMYYVPATISVYALNVEHNTRTKGVIDGEIKLPDNSGHWDSILINSDTVDGNEGIDVSGSGTLNGNAENQTKIGQFLFFFYKCSNCSMTVKTLRENYGPDPYNGDSPPDHPLGPFDFGVPFGEASSTNPPYSAGLFISGNNNNVSNFELLNWGREGVFHWFSSGSSIDNFVAINGVPSDNLYYEHVDFGSSNVSADLLVGSNVVVSDEHTAGGKPCSIYSSLVVGVTNLTLEDYSDAARWVLVERDYSLDYGYTAARCGGGGSHSNSITSGIAKYCRASSFSVDSVNSTIDNVISYHNSFQVGVNFGHAGTPASGSVGSNLVSVNAGWKGGLSGSSYGINIVAFSEDVTINGFTVIGAGRAGLNISSNGSKTNISNGSILHSSAQGLNTFAAGTVLVSNVRATNNFSGDFVVGTGSVLSLSNCEDTNGQVPDHQIDEENISRAFELQSRDSKVLKATRGIFNVLSGFPAAIVNFDTQTSNDNMVLTVGYSERNLLSAPGSSQFAAEEVILVSGSGGTRTITSLSKNYSLNRGFRYTWTISSRLTIYVQDGSGNDVPVLPNQNSLTVKVQTNANANARIEIG